MDILTSSTELSYPLYACDFDAQDPSRLLVGGGGGSSRTGVSNSITLLRISAAGDPSLEAVASIELSKDEDNVTSLATGPRRETATIAYAGVNSSPADQKVGKNEHFRVFGVDGAAAEISDKDKDPQITELARASFFAPPPTSGRSDDTYQRLVRVSAPFSDGHGGLLPQIGACATGLAQTGTAQVVLFDVAADGPVLPRVRSRIEALPGDVTDLDVIQTGVDTFQLVFCTDHEVFLYDVAADLNQEPRLVHTIKLDTASGATERPTFRAIRYLTPLFVLAALNEPRRMGVLLQGLRLPTGPGSARMGVHVRVPRKVLTQATALAVRSLAPPAAPGTRTGPAQFVVAVAGAPDNTLALYTLEQQTEGGVDALAKLYPFRTLRQVHELQMTSIALSPFRPPPADAAAASPLYLHLASVSVKNTVVVHHIPLRPLAASVSDKTAPPPRYVVAIPSRAPSGKSLYLFVAVMMVVVSLMAQGLLEVLGATAPVLGAREVVPAAWLRPLPQAPPIVVASSTPAAAVPVGNDANSLTELLRGAASGDGDAEDGGAPKVLFLRGEDAGQTIEVATHDEAEHGPAVAWEGLSPEQQTAWRQQLQDAGHWGEEMGQTVFRGILFREMAGIVRGVLE